jgi:iron-sulfur cluster repair protein YtfE (RIC family)
MDVYQILIQDHRKIAKMFEKIALISDKEAEQRRQLLSDLWIILEDHEFTEENDLLPIVDDMSSLSANPETNATIKKMVAQGLDDHAAFEAILQRISKLPANDDGWLEQFNELRDISREHMRNEEQKLFPAAQEVLDQTQAEEIARQIGERRLHEGRSTLATEHG